MAPADDESSWRSALIPRRRDALVCAVVCLGYILAALIGFKFAFATAQVTSVWPPAGIALAAFYLRGPRIWPGVFLGALISNAISHEPLLTAIGIATGNTLGPLLGGQLLRRYGNFDRVFARSRDILFLLLFGAIAMVVTASNGAANLALSGLVPWERYPSVWATWWVGDTMGALIVAPVILTLGIASSSSLSPARHVELAALYMVAGLGAVLLFSSGLPLAYPIFPIIIWAALRFPQSDTARVVLLISSIAVWQTAHDQGPFAAPSLDTSLGLLVSFMAVLSVTGFILGSMVAQRQRAEGSLRQANEDLEERVRTRTGELAALNISLDEALAGVLRDVNERKAAEEKLRQSEERFRGAFETAAHGMALLSTDGRWLKVNKAICDIVGYTEAELLAIDFQTITHPDDLDADLDHVRELLDGKIQTYQMEKRYFHKAGRIIWILLSVSLVRDVAGEPIHFVSQIIDITARREAEQKLAAAHAELAAGSERWDALGRTSRDMVVNYLPDTTMTYVSSASLSALGYQPDELVGRRIQDFIHPDELSQAARDLGRIAKGGSDGPSFNMRLRARHKDGSWRWMEGRPRPVSDNEIGAIKSYYDVMRDVTSQVEMEHSLAEALSRAERAAQVKSEFLANISHELRTPLNSVIGYARLLGRSNALGREDHRFVDLIQTAGETTLSLVNNVLDASALEGGALLLRAAPFDLREVLSNVANVVRHQAETRKLDLRHEFDARITPLYGDCGRIRKSC